METDSASSQKNTRKSESTRKFVVSLLHGLGCGLILMLTGKYLAGYEGPIWVKLVLLLLPWLLMVASIRHLRRVWSEDELEKIINRDAMAFTSWGALFVLILVNQLQVARVLPGFKWGTGQIALLMVLLLTAGLLWSQRRFR